MDGSWVFRFPRRAIVVPGFTRELEVLPTLAPRLPLPVPTPTFRGRPSENYPWPFAGSIFLPGREIAETALPESERVALARPLGEFLRALHTLRRDDLPVEEAK